MPIKWKVNVIRTIFQTTKVIAHYLSGGGTQVEMDWNETQRAKTI